MQNQAQAEYGPATGVSATAAGQAVYYLDSAGDVYSDRVGVAGVAGKQTLIAKIGAGYTQIAVSGDGKYLAALRDERTVHRADRRPARAAAGLRLHDVELGPDRQPVDDDGRPTSRSSCSAPARASTAAQAKPIAVTVTSGPGIVTASRSPRCRSRPTGCGWR